MSVLCYIYLLIYYFLFSKRRAREKCGVGWMGTGAGYGETFMNMASLASILLIQYHLWISVALFKGSFDFVYYTPGWWNRIIFIVWEYFTSCLTSVRIVIKTSLLIISYSDLGYFAFLCVCVSSMVWNLVWTVSSPCLCAYIEKVKCYIP